MAEQVKLVSGRRLWSAGDTGGTGGTGGGHPQEPFLLVSSLRPCIESSRRFILGQRMLRFLFEDRKNNGSQPVQALFSLFELAWATRLRDLVSLNAAGDRAAGILPAIFRPQLLVIPR